MPLAVTGSRGSVALKMPRVTRRLLAPKLFLRVTILKELKGLFYPKVNTKIYLLCFYCQVTHNFHHTIYTNVTHNATLPKFPGIDLTGLSRTTTTQLPPFPSDQKLNSITLV
jgi:hypothetical protein